MPSASHRHVFSCPDTARGRQWGRWVPVAARRPQMSPRWWQWVASSDSLTARLIAASPQAFHVRLISQGVAIPRYDEAQALGLAVGRVAWIREVMLMSGERPWVVARSVAPLDRIGCRRLRTLGERSLGSWLFAQPDLERGPIELATAPHGNDVVWLRRSRFRHASISLLVQEGFRREMAEDLGLALTESGARELGA